MAEFYNGNPNLPKANQVRKWTKKEIEDKIRCENDPVYFAEKHFKIIHVDRGIETIKLFDFQKEAVQSYLDYRRTCLLTSRQIGKCASLNTLIKLKNKKTGKEIEITGREFAKLLIKKDGFDPESFTDEQLVEYISGRNYNTHLIPDKIIASLQLEDWEILTDTGYEEITNFHLTKKFFVWSIMTKNGKYLECADEHILFDENCNEVYVKDLSIGSLIQTIDGVEEVLSINVSDVEENMFDITVNSNNHRFYTNGILSHNTTIATVIILHYCLFNKDKRVYLLANKGESAREILDRIQLAYEYLPEHIKAHGVTTWNKGSVEFGNGSRIVAAATSASSIRGKTCVAGDTKVCVEHDNGNIYFVNINNVNNILIPKEYIHTIYKITNTLDGKEYFGYHKISREGILNKAAIGSIYSDGYMGSGKLIKCAIEKNGPDKFFQELIGVYDTREDAFNIGRELANKEWSESQEIQTLNGEMKILSEGKFRDFDGVKSMGYKKTGVLSFTDGTTITCTEDHEFKNDDGEWIEAASIDPFSTFSGKTFQSFKENDVIEVYDAIKVADTNSFWANGITAHNCNLLYIDETAFVEGWDEFSASVLPTISSGDTTKMILTSTPNGMNHFYKICTNAKKEGSEGWNGYHLLVVPWYKIPGRDEKWKQNTLAEMDFDLQKFTQEYEAEFHGSSGTLIAGWKLKELTPLDPIVEKDNLMQYYLPETNHIYVIICDISRGKGLDYSAFQVIDITGMPYKQVAVFRSNTLAPSDCSPIIHKLAKLYNDAHVLVEINDIGGQVSDSLYYDFEYENLINTESAGRVGKRVCTGTSSNYDRGVRTTKIVKSIGCSIMKMLIEQNQLLINDFYTINELSTFSKKATSFEAEVGCHDDLVMCLVLFGWLVEDPYMKDMTDIETMKNLRERTDEDVTELLMPFGFSDGVNNIVDNTPLSPEEKKWHQEFNFRYDPDDFIEEEEYSRPTGWMN